MVKRVKKLDSSTGLPKKKKMSAQEREELLIENFIGLQRAMINLSMKFENLSDNISKLLNVFELSAKDYMINKGRTTPDVDRELLNRINLLLEQNKIIMGSVRSLDDKTKKQEVQKTNTQPISTQVQQPIQSAPQSTQPTSIPQGMQQSQYTPSKPKTIVQTI